VENGSGVLVKRKNGKRKRNLRLQGGGGGHRVTQFKNLPKQVNCSKGK